MLLGGAAIATWRRVRRLRAHLDEALHQATHDSLTGLRNRLGALTYLRANPVDLVGLLDLDHFKNVNDRYGHCVGDELLITVAARLKTAMAGQGIAARLAGDEFLLIWTQPGPAPMQRAAVLLDQVSAPIIVSGHTVAPHASLGLALPGPHHPGPGSLIGEADEAMYEAKRLPPRADTDGEFREPRARVHSGFYPPGPNELKFTGRRTMRDRRPTGHADEASISLEEGGIQ